MKPIHSLPFLTSFMVVALATGSLRAQPSQDPDPEPEWFEHRRDNAWLQTYDPTLISRRVLSEFTFEHHGGDEDFWKIENSLRWGIPVGQDLAFGMQFMAPVKRIDTDEVVESGIGDLEVRTGFVGRFTPALRWGAGLNAKFDTATDPAIGDHALVLRPILAVRWDAMEHLNLGLNIEYDFTPKDEEGDDESALQVKIPLAIRLTDDWSGAVTYKPRRDLLAEFPRHRLEFGATRLFGSRHHFALSFGVEAPLSSEAFEQKVITGLAWSF